MQQFNNQFISADMFQTPPLSEAVVFLQRFGGMVKIRELTGAQVMKAARYGSREINTDNGSVSVPDGTKQRAIKLAMALVEPALGENDELKAAAFETIQNLPYADQLLLMTVLDLLADGKLSDEQRDLLRQEKSAVELLDALGTEESPTAVIDAVEGEEVADLLSVGLRVPQALFGQVPMSVVKILAARIREEQIELAKLINAG